ncbi:hypothetical protein [Sinorhizobium meliloti]|uniref:hypothetical protein n=1 Tax=Rhizobium meliloti TaxID=382 RepID=UPI000FD6BC33|nr:hypothetical protein [Sinorhizobium meliloti]MQX61300.1 hypothetical protein [Sinorhizobium meliloti]RVO90619.1 hypothetical protein CN088_05745 [Sinorhizobium meliloti]RVQ14160.1 hypothetical protein CN063_13685 [Sinorhizobium meliloti]
MTTKHRWSPAKIKGAAKLAVELGVSIELKPDGSMLIAPASAEPVMTAAPERWEAREPGKPTLYEKEPAKGPHGYPIVDDPNHPLRQWYDRLGFDPHTMGQEDMERLQEKAHAEWEKSIPGTPLGKREKSALAQLAGFGPGIMVEWTKIKNCGPDTEDRLKARGFIETRPSNKWPDQIAYYVLTIAGYEAWNNLGKSPKDHMNTGA